MKLTNVITALVLAAIATPALAHYTFQDSGDMLEPGRFAIGSEIQFITSGDERAIDSGVNVLGKFDGGINDELGYRMVLGTGNTNMQLNALIKWVPVPDFEKQPAFGIVAGPMFARYEKETELSLRVVPFTSKKFEVEVGSVTPYAAVPFAIRRYADDTDAPFQAVIGSKYAHPDIIGAEFTAEIGFEIDKSFSYVSFGAIFPLDENNKFQFQQE